jgi:type IX secretion system PorP/SprF family membrane protein
MTNLKVQLIYTDNKMRNKIILCATLLFTLTQVQAQYRANFYTHLLNPFLANPAEMSHDNMQAIFNARTLVGGIDNSPRTMNFSITSPFATNTGVGLKMFSHWIGAFQTTNAEATYNKRITLINNHTLTFGLSMGFIQTALNQNALNTQVNRADPMLMTNELNKVFFTAGSGVSYKYKDKLDIYTSSPMMATGSEPLSGFFVSGASYRFNLDAEGLYQLKPAVNYYNFIESPKLADILVAASWNKIISVQTGYRTNGAIVSGVGFNFTNFLFQYNYYHHVGELNRFAPAQNEVAIVLNFKKFEKRIRKKQEVVDEAIIQDQIEKISLRINGLMNIETTNPGLVNVKSELVKINKDLEKILSKYKIENIEQLKKIKELQTAIDLLIVKYNEQ